MLQTLERRTTAPGDLRASNSRRSGDDILANSGLENGKPF
jgi:hypothetical protein